MDKEIALLLSEMLVKQDENSWEQQHSFNEIFANELKGIRKDAVMYAQ